MTEQRVLVYLRPSLTSLPFSLSSQLATKSVGTTDACLQCPQNGLWTSRKKSLQRDMGAVKRHRVQGFPQRGSRSLLINTTLIPLLRFSSSSSIMIKHPTQHRSLYELTRLVQDYNVISLMQIPDRALAISEVLLQNIKQSINIMPKISSNHTSN